MYNVVDALGRVRCHTRPQDAAHRDLELYQRPDAF